MAIHKGKAKGMGDIPFWSLEALLEAQQIWTFSPSAQAAGCARCHELGTGVL